MPDWALAVQLQTPTDPRAANPARARGLKRAGATRAPCEPAAWSPIPAPVDAVHLLALQTRVRSARIAGSELAASRRYDVRAYKAAVALLGYLRTLTRRSTGGTVVTSMPQLIVGVARMRGAWTMTGDKFADRDRHQQTLRRALRDLDAMGVVVWTIGVDVNGEDARTELQLRSAPDVTDEELADAAAQLTRWRARYGAALNTGSSTGIRNAATHARPLSASVRQRRGIARTRARARSRGEASTSNSAPHFVAPPMAENSQELSSNPGEFCHVGGSRTGAREPVDQVPDNGSCLSRPDTPQEPKLIAAISAEDATTSLKTGGSDPPEGASAQWDESALRERVAARLAARRPVWDLIATQAQARALETACWSLDRGWPLGRLREAWVVWRHGAQCAAELGPVAGWLEPDDPERLRRAAVRYELYVDARPAGFPERGLAALAHIAAIAAETGSRPDTLRYGIRALDQLSRGMRAGATAHDAQRIDRATARAARRRDTNRRRGNLPFEFRDPRRWPPWVALDAAGEPLLDENGDLVATAVSGPAGLSPDREDAAYRAVLRDAHLLRGLWPPPAADGRDAMAETRTRFDAPADHRRADAGPYAPPEHRRGRVDDRDLRLARLSGMPLRKVQRLDVPQRDELLARHDADAAVERSIERDSLWRSITAIRARAQDDTC